MAKTAERKKGPSKVEILTELANQTGLTRKDVEKVIDALTTLIGKHIKKTDDVFTLPGLIKIKNVRKKATQERNGVNPKTKEAIKIAGKPAHNVIKVTPLKVLKEFVEPAGSK